MFIAAETLRSTGMDGSTGLWMLALFLLGLSAMAYLTVREVSLYETKSSLRSIRRNRKGNFPHGERLSLITRGLLRLKRHLRGQEFREAIEPATVQGVSSFEIKLRKEIDKLVGKQVYLGKKEQL